MAARIVVADDTPAPPIHGDGEHLHNVSCRDRYIAWASNVIHNLAGNYRPKTTAGRIWRFASHGLFLLMGLSNYFLQILYGDEDLDGEIDPIKPQTYFWCFFGFPLIATATILIVVRGNRQQKVRALEKVRMPKSGSTFVSAAVVTMGLGFITFNLSMTVPGFFEAQPALKLFLRILLTGGMAIVFPAGLFSCCFTAGTYMKASRVALQRFNNDVRSVALSALDLERQEVEEAAAKLANPGIEVTNISSGINIGSDSVPLVMATTVEPIAGPTQMHVAALSRRVQALAKINASFNTAREIVTAMNDILDLPLSIIFVMGFVGGAQMWYFGFITEGESSAAIGGVLYPSMSIFLLVWTATVGDEFVNAKRNLLYPDTALGLQSVLGRDGQIAFTHAVEKTELGFALVHVTITGHRVLYVIFSLLLLVVYMIPK